MQAAYSAVVEHMVCKDSAPCSNHMSGTFVSFYVCAQILTRWGKEAIASWSLAHVSENRENKLEWYGHCGPPARVGSFLFISICVPLYRRLVSYWIAEGVCSFWRMSELFEHVGLGAGSQSLSSLNPSKLATSDNGYYLYARKAHLQVVFATVWAPTRGHQICQHGELGNGRKLL